MPTKTYLVIEEEECPMCAGRGLIEGADFTRVCLDCDGSGYVRREVNLVDVLAGLGVYLGEDLPAAARSIAAIRRIRTVSDATLKEGA